MKGHKEKLLFIKFRPDEDPTDIGQKDAIVALRMIHGVKRVEFYDSGSRKSAKKLVKSMLRPASEQYEREMWKVDASNFVCPASFSQTLAFITTKARGKQVSYSLIIPRRLIYRNSKHLSQNSSNSHFSHAGYLQQGPSRTRRQIWSKTIRIT